MVSPPFPETGEGFMPPHPASASGSKATSRRIGFRVPMELRQTKSILSAAAVKTEKIEGSASALPLSTTLIQSGCDMRISIPARDQLRTGHGHHPDLARRCRFHPSHLSHRQVPHLVSGVVDLLSAIETNLVGLVAEGKWASDTAVTTAKQDLCEETHNGTQAENQGVHGCAPFL